MSLLSRILEHSRNARVPRALDPETHEPIPYGTEQPALVRIGAWILKTSWVERAILKWSAAIATALTAWLLGKGAGDHTEAIVAGVTAAITFLYEQLASYLTSKASMKIPPAIGLPTAAQESASFTESTSNSGPSFTRSAMFQALLAQSPRSRPTPEEDEEALASLRASLAPTQRINLPTQAELDATRAKLHGYSVEVDGEVHDFIDKQAAYAYHQLSRSEGKRSTLLF